MAQSGGVDVTKHVGKSAKGGGGASGASGEVNSDIAGKVTASTGVDVGDVVIEEDPKLEEAGKSGVAKDSKTVAVKPNASDSTLAHELVHVVQMRGGSGVSKESEGKTSDKEVNHVPEGSGKAVDVEAEANEGSKAILSGQKFDVKGKASGPLYEEQKANEGSRTEDAITSSAAAGFADGRVAAEHEKLAKLRRIRIAEFIVLADKYQEKREAGEEIPGNEQIPYSMVRQMILEENISLLALWIGTANWGVSGVPSGLEDPAALAWKGPEVGKGKRPRDYKKGGLGISHFDDARLNDVYEKYGFPQGLTKQDLFKDGEPIVFDRLRNFRDTSEKRRWQLWEKWAKNLVEQAEFVEWSMEKWDELYWQTAEATNDDVDETIVNSRIRNSASGIGRASAGESVSKQESEYEGYGRRRGEERANAKGLDVQKTADEREARHHRQMLQARRVMVLIEFVSDEAASQTSVVSAREADLPCTRDH